MSLSAIPPVTPYRTPRCLCGCGRLARTRGLGAQCYAVAQKAVRAGQVTWEELIAAGKALEATRSSIRSYKT